MENLILKCAWWQADIGKHVLVLECLLLLEYTDFRILHEYFLIRNLVSMREVMFDFYVPFLSMPMSFNVLRVNVLTYGLQVNGGVSYRPLKYYVYVC